MMTFINLLFSRIIAEPGDLVTIRNITFPTSLNTVTGYDPQRQQWKSKDFQRTMTGVESYSVHLGSFSDTIRVV